MKKRILCIIFMSLTSIILGQQYEIGVSLGGTNYVGDIGSTRYIYPNQLAGNGFFKYNYNTRIALKTTFSYLPIYGNDNAADNSFRKSREFHFFNIINEVALGMEYSFYEYDTSVRETSWTPYITIELAGFNYKTIQEEKRPRDYIYTNKTSFSVPFGIGFKSKLFGKFAYSLETKFRYTFEDDLDYTTNKIATLDYGGNGNDWYVFTGFSLIYTFGRPACYTKGL